MNTSQLLTDYLKRLRTRAGLTPAELAAKCGMSMGVIYKAEDQRESVRIGTIRSAYKGLCHNEREYDEVLMRWAMGQDPEYQGSLYRMSETLTGLQEEARQEISGKMERAMSSLAQVPEADLNLLEEFIRQFASNPHARTMARAWLDAVKGPE